MALAATLYTEDSANARQSERRAATLDATMRDGDLVPHDVTITDVSQHGFRGRFPLALAEESVVRIGLSGVGTREARVIWASGREHGCAFLQPLSPAQLETALVTDTLVYGAFAAEPALGPMIDDGKLPGWVRLLLIIIIPAAMWATMFWLGSLLLS